MSEVPSAAVLRAAQQLGLTYVAVAGDGIVRLKRRGGFEYRSAGAEVIRSTDVLERIAALAIPPAWTEVWICPDACGHIQATGRDAKRRKQYRYHAQWRAHRERTKFERLADFGAALGAIRARVEADLNQRALCRTKVLATVVRLLELTLIRVGNEEYARTNRTYGLTTLCEHHVDVNGAQLTFHFRGKSGKQHTVNMCDRRLARIVSRCQELPGHELFHVFDSDGTKHKITSGDVNAYLREISGADFTAKDFRTWSATVLAAEFLSAEPKLDSNRQRTRAMLKAIEAVSKRLGNTPAICRKSYIHPRVLEAFADNALELPAARQGHGLNAMEQRVLRFLSKPPGQRAQARGARLTRDMKGARSQRAAEKRVRRSAPAARRSTPATRPSRSTTTQSARA